MRAMTVGIRLQVLQRCINLSYNHAKLVDQKAVGEEA